MFYFSAMCVLMVRKLLDFLPWVLCLSYNYILLLVIPIVLEELKGSESKRLLVSFWTLVRSWPVSSKRV